MNHVINQEQKMSAIYDNWGRLVAAVLKKQQLWELFHAQSRSPSILSEASDSAWSATSFNLDDSGFDFSTSSSLRHKSSPNLVLVSDFSTRFDLKDVSRASSELLGKGIFGSAYAATMNNGARIVVKRLKPMTVSEVDFERYVEIVGDIRHDNVVSLRGYYSSNGERMILYDYYGEGGVFSLLHGQRDRNLVHVDWVTRLKIAIGAARGIAEIHTELGGMLVHGNVKASNVFLNQQSYGCVSDLGLASMIKTTFDSTARCYAPEVKNTRDVSHASDVYGFGILLLELLTRKSSVNVPGGPPAVDLVKLVNSAKSKKMAAKVFDADLLQNLGIRKRMVILLDIGIQCVAKSIKKRPKMSEVLKMLEDIFSSSPISPNSLRNELVFVEDGNPAFELEDMLRAPAERLGKGTFGNCYLARLGNGNTVVVKRLKNLIISNKDFQRHMEILGRKHENVFDIQAYYFSRKEQLLVYNYYSQGSLHDLLHGKMGKHLDWGERVDIAVGAARGIAHIHSHRKVGQKIVHGNIKSSNIFLNGKTYGIVSYAGLTKLTYTYMLPGVFSQAYTAPEIRATREMSQASDVYSFGVVLLELLSGKHTMDDGGVFSLVEWIQDSVNDIGIAGVLDTKCSTYENADEMKQVFGIAMRCISIAPEERPVMPVIVQLLEEICGSRTTLEEPGKQLSFILRRQETPFDTKLEYLLEDLLPTLTS